MLGLATASLIDFGIQALVGSISVGLATEKFYDLTGSLTFVVLAVLSYKSSFGGTRQFISTGALVVARLYLAAFLFYRILQEGKDGRFDRIRHNTTRFSIAWFLQGVWILLVSLPILYINGSRTNKPLGSFGLLACLMIFGGLALEMTADLQKFQFKNDPSNEGKFFTQGVWSFCRHPNYLGEILMTFGFYLLSLPCLKGLQHLAILSPLFTAFLLIRVSGIPLSEKHWMKKYQGMIEFEEYFENTAKLIPYVW